MKTKKEIGDLGERAARRYLRRHGYRILHKNWRYGRDELDIIAKGRGALIFAEVKTRSYTREELVFAPPPGHAVDAHKQQHTRAAARAYLRAYPTHLSPRMDVIEVFLEKTDDGKKPRILFINHIPGAY